MAKGLGVAVLEGHRLSFTAFSRGWDGGVADVVETVGDKVWGLLYELTPEDLSALDVYEGYPHLYDRRRLHVVSEANHLAVEAWVYFVVNKQDFVIPAAKYLAVLVECAKEFGFPREYVADLESMPVR
jgi:gamma-glutamylcyclotransferase (GGCT)/AIG2-like uncharacterized protein YtfP